MDYLKISRAEDLEGSDRRLYRLLEILPGFLSWATLALLVLLSYFKPVIVAYFLIAFDVYWLLLVLFLGIHLLFSYRSMMASIKIDWAAKLKGLKGGVSRLAGVKVPPSDWTKIIHLVVFPIAFESHEVIEASVKAIAEGTYPVKNMILLLAVEERGGDRVKRDVEKIIGKYGGCFMHCFLSIHPDGLVGEIKGKGSNQAYGAAELKREIIDKYSYDYDRILVSVFDIDTIIYPDYFWCLSYNFLTAPNPYRSSYQPIPVYHNNIWQAPFFARVAAASNTFWQMMLQIRQEKLATYSSHSMTWNALVDIGFWSKNMVSEDSRIFWHCFCYYNGDYRVVPLHYPVSMDATMDDSFIKTAKNLYKQQRRWGWGVENIPYMLFNTGKRWKNIPKWKFINQTLVQMHGFHSWATNAIIIAAVGWLPLILGGDRFNETVLSTNLPFVTQLLMTLAMVGLILSSVMSTILLPKRPKRVNPFKYLVMIFQWLLLPITIVIFGALPGLEAQTRLMLSGKWRLGFFVTPKSR